MDAEVHTPPEQLDIEDGVRAEIVIWKVPRPLKGSVHRFKYRLALVVDDVCVCFATTTRLARGTTCTSAHESSPTIFVIPTNSP
jgi:hypothetical protein